jgi:hypothetical protein
MSYVDVAEEYSRIFDDRVVRFQDSGLTRKEFNALPGEAAILERMMELEQQLLDHEKATRK